MSTVASTAKRYHAVENACRTIACAGRQRLPVGDVRRTGAPAAREHAPYRSAPRVRWARVDFSYGFLITCFCAKTGSRCMRRPALRISVSLAGRTGTLRPRISPDRGFLRLTNRRRRGPQADPCVAKRTLACIWTPFSDETLDPGWVGSIPNRAGGTASRNRAGRAGPLGGARR